MKNEEKPKQGRKVEGRRVQRWFFDILKRAGVFATEVRAARAISGGWLLVPGNWGYPGESG